MNFQKKIDGLYLPKEIWMEALYWQEDHSAEVKYKKFVRNAPERVLDLKVGQKSALQISASALS